MKANSKAIGVLGAAAITVSMAAPADALTYVYPSSTFGTYGQPNCDPANQHTACAVCRYDHFGGGIDGGDIYAAMLTQAGAYSAAMIIYCSNGQWYWNASGYTSLPSTTNIGCPSGTSVASGYGEVQAY
jgi:hypothetical protein